MTDAELRNADGIARAAKGQGAASFAIDIDFLIALLTELRAHRGIPRKAALKQSEPR